jgi:hypothetical protein
MTKTANSMELRHYIEQNEKYCVYCCLLGHDDVYFGREVPTFQRNILPPYSGQRNMLSMGKRISSILYSQDPATASYLEPH